MYHSPLNPEIAPFGIALAVFAAYVGRARRRSLRARQQRRRLIGGGRALRPIRASCYGNITIHQVLGPRP